MHQFLFLPYQNYYTQITFVNIYLNIDLTLCAFRANMSVMKKYMYQIALLTMFATPTTADAFVERDVASLRIMNKAAGKTYSLDIPVGNSAQFEKLDIVVRSCKQTDPFDAEDYFAFLEISTATDGKVFSNWMSRNEPGVRPLQNADYDVWLVTCKSKD